MQDSKQSPCTPDYLKAIGASLRDGSMSVIDDAMDIVQSDKEMRSGITLATVALTAILCPVPFMIAGVLSVTNGAVNGTERKVKKDNGSPDPTPAAAG